MPIVGTRRAMSRIANPSGITSLTVCTGVGGGGVALLPPLSKMRVVQPAQREQPEREDAEQQQHGHETAASARQRSSPARRSRYPCSSTAAAAASSPSGRRGARSRAILVVNRSSSITIGIAHRSLSRPTNDAVSAACGPFCPASVNGKPTTINSGRSRSMIADSSASPARAAARRTIVSGRASVPEASEIATPVRPLP